MKYFLRLITILLVTSCIVFGEYNFNEIENALNSIKNETFIESLKRISKNSAKNGDDGHWCCKITPPVVATDQTRLVSFNHIMSSTHVCGYTGCGFLGWSSCATECTNYWINTVYHIETFTVYIKQQCPPEQVICCTGYLYVLGHCMDIADISNNIELLHQLQQEGIVIPGLPIG